MPSINRKMENMIFLFLGIALLVLSLYVSFFGHALLIIPIILTLYTIMFFGFMINKRGLKKKGISEDEA